VNRATRRRIAVKSFPRLGPVEERQL
jgi:hypothetical protein